MRPYHRFYVLFFFVLVFWLIFLSCRFDLVFTGCSMVVSSGCPVINLANQKPLPWAHTKGQLGQNHLLWRSHCVFVRVLKSILWVWYKTCVCLCVCVQGYWDKRSRELDFVQICETDFSPKSHSDTNSCRGPEMKVFLSPAPKVATYQSCYYGDTPLLLLCINESG